MVEILAQQYHNSLPFLPGFSGTMPLEWGGESPQTHLMTQGANFAPRMGGGSPQTPLMMQEAANPPKEAISLYKTKNISNFPPFFAQTLTDWAGSGDKRA